MALDTVERQVLVDLLHAVGTLASQVVTLHLQLGAVRTVLARKGTLTSAEFSAALAGLGAVSLVDQVVDPDAPDVNHVFDDLLRRLQAPQT